MGMLSPFAFTTHARKGSAMEVEQAVEGAVGIVLESRQWPVVQQASMWNLLLAELAHASRSFDDEGGRGAVNALALPLQFSLSLLKRVTNSDWAVQASLQSGLLSLAQTAFRWRHFKAQVVQLLHAAYVPCALLKPQLATPILSLLLSPTRIYCTSHLPL
jgi:hypothetical protein